MTPPEPTPPQTSRFEASLSRQLSTIREMLETLETLTMAGQRHVMAKVVAFIRANGDHFADGFGCNDESLAGDLLGRLSVESQRLAPDAQRFGQHAQSLVDLLTERSQIAA